MGRIKKLALRVGVILAVSAETATLVNWARASEYFVTDDFSGEVRYFFEGEVGGAVFAYKPQDKAFEIDAMQASSYSLAVLTDAFFSYEVTLDVQVRETGFGSESFAGVAFFYAEDGEGRAKFFAVTLFPDGYFGVASVTQGQRREYVIPLTETTLMSPAGFNELRLKVGGGKGEVYINGGFAGEFTYPAGLKGGVGLLAGPKTKAYFRNFKWRVFDPVELGSFSGPFGLIPGAGLEIIFKDDFQTPTWKVGRVDSSSLSYRNGRYVLDNLRGDKLVLSYLSEPSVRDAVYSAVFAGFEGSPGNGFGLAYGVQESGEGLSYIGFVIARDQTFRLFVQNGQDSISIAGWEKLPLDVDFEKPVALSLTGVAVEDGTELVVGVNGKPILETILVGYDSGGGLGLISAPGVSAEVSGVMLVSIKDVKDEFLSAVQKWKEDKARKALNEVEENAANPPD